MTEEVKTVSMLEEYNKITGREFATEVEAVKHLENLQKLAFAKTDDLKKEAKIELEVEYRENEAKKIKEEVDKLLPYKQFVEQAGVKDMTKVNPLAIAEYLGEQHEDIKPRTEAVDAQAGIKSLEEKIRSGKANQEDRNEYMRKTVLNKK